MKLVSSEPHHSSVSYSSPSGYIAFGFLATIVLGVAQLYYFGMLQSAISQLSGSAFAFAVTFATSFFVFSTIAAIRYLFMMVSAYLGWSHTVRPKTMQEPWPLVSVILPAFNEAEHIADALESILAAKYPHIEVIVVDDGSTDDTFSVACRYAGQRGGANVRVLHKPNGGKSTALNLGFRESIGSFILSVDADSRLERNALRRLVTVMQAPDVGAAVGQVRVRNRGSWITRLQALEYAFMNGMPRLAQSNFGHVLIAPGPIAMFRRGVLEEIWMRWGKEAPGEKPSSMLVKGPWESDTYAEDCDVTLNTLMLNNRVLFEPAAISFTASPDSLPELLNQRYRWIRGNIQAVRKNWRRWHAIPDPPRVFPLWLVIFIVENILWPLINIYGLVMFIGLMIVVGEVGTFIPWYLILTLIEVNAAAFSIRTMGEKRILILLCPIFRSIYSVILDVNTLVSSLDELFRRRMHWT